MGGDIFPNIPNECRSFGESDFDERRRVAKSFIKMFVEKVATPKGPPDNSDEAWTQSVQSRFTEICPDDCCALTGEPLTITDEYFTGNNWVEKENYKRLLVVCESKWGSDQLEKIHWTPVEKCFKKLLAIKAPFKVLIFSSVCENGESTLNNDSETDFSFEYAKKRLKESLDNYRHHIPGEVYILIDLPQTRVLDGDGIYRTFIWTATKFGKSDVEFENGPCGKLIRPL